MQLIWIRKLIFQQPFLMKITSQNFGMEKTKIKPFMGGIKPLLSGTGDISDDPYIEPISDNLWFLVGDLSLSRFEDELTQQWTRCLDRHERAFRVVSAFWRLMQTAAIKCEASLILVDLGPNLGSITRSVLISTDYLVIPLAPDLFFHTRP